MRNVSVQLSRVDLAATQFVASEGHVEWSHCHRSSMSYLHIKYRNPCKVPSHKQISLSFTRAVAVCMCVFLYSPRARKCCQVDCFYECIAYFAAPQGRPWVQLSLAYRANSVCTLIAAAKLEVLAELATVRGAARLPVCLAA